MQTKRFQIILTLVLIFAMVVGIFGFAAPNEDTARLVFSGMTMTRAKDGSIQAFLDVDLRKIETNGVGFTLRYNTDYVEASDFEDNSVLTSDNEGRFLKINDRNFPAGFMQEPLFINEAPYFKMVTPASVRTSEDDNFGEMEVYLSANPNASYNGEYVYDKTIVDSGKEVQTKIINANKVERLNIASLSFRVKNAAEFAKLDSSEVSRIFTIAKDEIGENAVQIHYIDMSQYPPHVFYDKNEHLMYEFEVKNTVDGVDLVNKDVTVYAAEIFEIGEYNDLIYYLNTYMKDVVVRYTDDTTIADKLIWGGDSFSYENEDGDELWNPQGGKYTVSQKYNDEMTVTTTVTVLPVSLVGYKTVNDYIVYPDASTAPTDIAELQLPTEAQPIFDRVVAGKTNITVSLEDAEWTDEDGFTTASDMSARDGEYTFSTEVDDELLPIWATVTAEAVSVKRCIGRQFPENADDFVITAATDDNGEMTVTVKLKDDEPIPSDTEISIRMPSGELLDKTLVEAGGGKYEVEISDGVATIKIKGNAAADSGEMAQRLQEFINMGDRTDPFELAIKAPNKLQSPWAEFSAESRNNYYTEGDYTYDYTGGKSAIFPIYNDATATTMPLTISIPDGNAVGTTYNGTTGAEPGSLRTVTVESWTVTGDLTAVGTEVTLTGKLADTEYVNYGMVQNDDDIKITIKAVVQDAIPPEKISPIDDFTYEIRTIGFGDDLVEDRLFLIKNIGIPDIMGLTVTMKGDTGAFVVGSKLPYLLESGNETMLMISTKTGTPVGVYTAEVTIGSNRTAELAKFTITFEVTDKQLYNVVVFVNDDDFGTATLVKGSMYREGDKVEIKIKLDEGCSVDSDDPAKVVQGSITNPITPDATDPLLYTFTMSEQEEDTVLRIQMNLTGPLESHLKLEWLESLNPDGSMNDLLDGTENRNKVEFSQYVRDYTVIVPSSVSQNKARLILKHLMIDDEEITVSATLNGTEVNVNKLELFGENETELFDIDALPKENELKITLACGEHERTYTLTINRRAAPSNCVEFDYGNSPYGLIMADDSITDKDEYKQKFADNQNTFTEGYTPKNGYTGVRYREDAWGLEIALSSDDSTFKNYDKDAEAYFAYNGREFTDPGVIKLTDSLLNPISEEALKKVKRSLKVNVMTAENPSTMTEDFNMVSSVKLMLPDGVDTPTVVDALKSLRIRPDVYYIEYTYSDYDDSRITVSRPLIILPSNGDVNVSGAVDDDDSVKIKGRYTDRLPYESLPGYIMGGFLYRYRVCDANNDGNANDADANLIHADKTPIKYYTGGETK